MATTNLRKQLLQLALPLVKTHGFTREALSLSALSLPNPHAEPLRDTAVSSLFGEGDEARRTLTSAWIDEGRTQMRQTPSLNVRDALHSRLRYNEPVLKLLPEAFATMALSSSSFHLIDPQPALKHAASVADEACVISGDTTTGTMWYARRASLAAIYSTAELHQLVSPKTAYEFLDSLLDTSTKVKNSLDEAGLFATYVAKSWAGILKSRGVF
ncbi:hypothetical protein PHLCEN_2v1384 [Hermanssonia centrifuga]|uniref:Ubiquinone biosynthesis protein n=1 Tax=Hermanssonia centrifuga TaxID=98765 RepID=A0A2R6S3B3_9APHY|nr:hypothetical protein PHLCEN_2v1384 [Hermanssonia centrifuga]